jgi:hypothetical protein
VSVNTFRSTYSFQQHFSNSYIHLRYTPPVCVCIAPTFFLIPPLSLFSYYTYYHYKVLKVSVYVSEESHQRSSPHSKQQQVSFLEQHCERDTRLYWSKKGETTVDCLAAPHDRALISLSARLVDTNQPLPESSFTPGHDHYKYIRSPVSSVSSLGCARFHPTLSHVSFELGLVGFH